MQYFSFMQCLVDLFRRRCWFWLSISFLSCIVYTLLHTPARGQANEVGVQISEASTNEPRCNGSINQLFSLSTQFQTDASEQSDGLRGLLGENDSYATIIDELTKCLDDYSSPQQQIKSAYVLGEVGECLIGGDALSTLCDFLRNSQWQDGDIEAAVNALQGVLSQQDRPSLPLLGEAAEALGKFGYHATSTVSTLIDALDTVDDDGHPAYRVRDDVTYAIVNIAARGASGNVSQADLSTLETLLSNADDDLQIRATQVLGHFGPSGRDLVSSLIDNLIQDEDLAVRESSAYAIEQIKIQNTEDIKRLIDVSLSENYAEDIREISFKLLAFLGSPPAQDITRIIQDLIDSEHHQPLSRILALWISAENDINGETGFPVERLISILENESDYDSATRSSALYFISESEYISREVINILNEIIRSKDEKDEIRSLAIYAISRAIESENTIMRDDDIRADALIAIQSVFKDVNYIHTNDCKVLTQASYALRLFPNIDKEVAGKLFSIVEHPSDPLEYEDEECFLSLQLTTVQTLEKLATSGSMSILEFRSGSSSLRLKSIFEELKLDEADNLRTLERLRIRLALSGLLIILEPAESEYFSNELVQMSALLRIVEDPREPGSVVANRQSQRKGLIEIVKEWFQ